jgi:hypothetical protein
MEATLQADTDIEFRDKRRKAQRNLMWLAIVSC